MWEQLVDFSRRGMPLMIREAFISTTVILPSGNHSLPSKGGPSSLIERWNSGGTCDCGDWDLGCKLRIFTSSNQINKKSSSSEHYSLIDQLLLFSQEGEVNNQLVLSMTMLKDKIFSLEFGSSLTHLQAFSIRLALLDSRNLLDESRVGQYGNQMTSNGRVVVKVPALQNPPLSPFGRV